MGGLTQKKRHMKKMTEARLKKEKERKLFLQVQPEDLDCNHNADRSYTGGSTELAGRSTELVGGNSELDGESSEITRAVGKSEETLLDISGDDEESEELLESGSDGNSDLDIEEDESNGKVYANPGD